MADMLGKYELRQILGKGAMGTVYEGYDPVIARRVAIKTVKLPDPEDVEALESLARFKREAQAAGRLSHPNIVGVFDYGETPELAYIVMEFVEGMTLKEMLDRGERLQISDILPLMEALLAGLEFSHQHGVVHRDIKPANIMITKTGVLKISDFGIARIESNSMTQAGTMLGTPSYMSPEQFMGQTVDARTDLYSSGVLLYQLLTGEKPFDGGLTAIMHKVLHTEPPAPSALSVTVTPALDAVVKKAIAKRPENRFSSAAEFAQALRTACETKSAPLESLSLSAEDFAGADATMVVASRPAEQTTPFPAVTPANPPPTPAKKSFRLALFSGGAVVLLAILAGGGYFLFGSRQRSISIPVEPTTPEVITTTAAPPALTLAQKQTALEAAFDSLPCTLLSANAQGGTITLTGLVGAGAPETALMNAIKSLPTGLTVSNQAKVINGPYCTALDTIRPYHALFTNPQNGRLQLSLAGGKTSLQNGDLITIDQRMPNFGGYLETDYLSSDGSVLRLYPTGTDAAQLFSAGASKTLGDAAHGGAKWQVSAPFGTDMIISIASSTPLFTALPPQEETEANYLSALREALQNVASGGGKISVSTLPVVTLPGSGG